MSEIGANKKCEWARGDIRDREIKMSHAIYYSSFLRSKVAAHAFSSNKEILKRIKTLSAYDVFNVQSLARQLLLERFKIWDLLGA
jgi:hypothetical protein